MSLSDGEGRMNIYLLYLDGYTDETIEAIKRNIRFWCVDFIERQGGSIEITTSYEFTPEFLESKGIPEDCVIKKL